MFGEMEERITEEEERRLLEEIDNDARWLNDNYEKYHKRYEGKLVAVKGKKIIASGSDAEELSIRIEALGEDPRWTFFASFPPKDLVFIL